MSEPVQISTPRERPVALRRASGWLGRLALLGLLFAGWQDAFAAEESVSKEYQVKAAFLYNFTKFLDWPAQSFGDADSPIVIGIFCPASFGAELQKIVADRRVNGRGLVVKQLETAAQASSVHLLFVCAPYDGQFAGIRSAIGMSPVLTVGESDSFRASGGAIDFVLRDDKVRFEINMVAAEQAQVKVSSQLQKLAITVRRAP